MTEPQQRSSWCRGDEFEDFRSFLVAHRFHDLPEHLDRWMFLLVVSNRVDSPVKRVPPQIRDVNLAGITTYECLQFRLIEHGKPRGLNDLPQALEEGICLQKWLHLQTVTCNIGDIDEAILIRNRDVGTVGLQLSSDSTCGSRCSIGICRAWKRYCICDREVEGKVFDITRVVLEL